MNRRLSEIYSQPEEPKSTALSIAILANLTFWIIFLSLSLSISMPIAERNAPHVRVCASWSFDKSTNESSALCGSKVSSSPLLIRGNSSFGLAIESKDISLTRSLMAFLAVLFPLLG